MRLISFILGVLMAAGAWAAPAEIDLTAAAMAGKEAQFTQRFTPKGFKNAQTESGTVLFGVLPAMRWSYTAPEEKIFVFDGTRSWFYVPADRQVTVGRIDDNRKRELPFLLIGDPPARQEYFVVREQSSGASVTTTLQPRDSAAMIRSIAIVTSAVDHLIRSVEYTDREGNRTAFELSGYHPHPASAAEFQFTPPAGVQVVNAE
jgi:outer membrane lipoprotein carrier protein